MRTVIIRTHGDPILREVCEETTLEQGREIADILEAVVGAVGAAGMAAPQVGEGKRVVCFRKGEEIVSLINPKVSAIESEEAEVDEGCWSILGVLAPVSRPAGCVIEGMRTDGSDVVFELEGMEARTALHEVDHLNGVLFIDHLPEVRRNIVLRKHRKFKMDKQIRASGIRIQLRP